MVGDGLRQIAIRETTAVAIRATTAVALRATTAVALGIVLVGCIADGLPAPTPLPTSNAARPGTPPASAATPVQTRAALDLGVAGSLVLARVDEDFVLAIVSVAPDGTEHTVGEPRSLQALVDPYTWEDGQIWLGPDGSVVVEERVDHDDPATYRLLWIDWADPAAVASILPQGRPLALAGGGLVVVNTTVTAFDARHPAGVTVPVPATVGLFGTTADSSLLLGIRSTEAADAKFILDPVVVGRDGVVAPWNPASGVRLTTGRERTIGANGETLSQWFDDGATGGSSGLNVVRPGIADDGRNIAPGPGGVGDWAWSGDGRTAFMLANGAVYAWSGGATSKVIDLPAPIRNQDGVRIVGLTDGGVILSNDFQGTTLIPLDGSAARTTEGRLLAVVPIPSS